MHFTKLINRMNLEQHICHNNFNTIIASLIFRYIKGAIIPKKHVKVKIR